MPDRFSRNGARAVAIAGVTLFVVILALLAVQMASGKDPALGARATKKTVNRVAATPQPVQPAPADPAYSDDPGYSDGYTDDGSQDGYVAPQQDAQPQYSQPQPQYSQPQQQSQAPLQSSTS